MLFEVASKVSFLQKREKNQVKILHEGIFISPLIFIGCLQSEYLQQIRNERNTYQKKTS